MRAEVGITVGEALEIESLRRLRLIAGKSGISRIITQVNVMEVPDIINWVSPGDFLLTTAYSIRKNKQAQIELIPALAKKGLAGIGIKPKRYIDEIPEEVKKLSDMYAFPLVEIPYEMSFTEVITPILMVIFNRQMDVILKGEEIHKKLMDVLLKGGDLKKIADVLSSVVGNPVVIEDYLFERSVGTGFELPGDPTFSYPITAGDEVYGKVLVWEINRPLKLIDKRAIEMASAMAALEINKERAIFEVERRYKTEFLSELFSDVQENVERACQRAFLFGISPTNWFLVIVIRIFGLESEKGKEPLCSKGFLSGYILRLAERYLKERGFLGVVGSRGDEVLVLIHSPDEINLDKVRSFGEALCEGFLKTSPELRIGVGIGRVYKGLKEAYKSYKDAKCAALSLQEYFRDPPVADFESLGIYRFLLQPELSEELKRFYAEHLLPLVEYDKKYNTELVKTLETFFASNRNLREVSKKLYLHRNTVLYRMNRIQQILNVDLKDPEVLFNLEVALRIHRLYNVQT